MSAPTLADVLAAMRAAGIFYAHHRPGLRVTTLWRKSDHGMAPVVPSWLRAWLAEHVSADVPYEMVTRVLSADLSGFTVVTTETARLIS
jgi:hypothetical protein